MEYALVVTTVVEVPEPRVYVKTTLPEVGIASTVDPVRTVVTG